MLANLFALKDVIKSILYHVQIKCVYYPGLPSHPEHSLAKRQMTGFGGVVSFEVRKTSLHLKCLSPNSFSTTLHHVWFITFFILVQVDGDLTTTAKFIDSLKIPYIAPSFGGCESIIDQPAIMSYW